MVRDYLIGELNLPFSLEGQPLPPITHSLVFVSLGLPLPRQRDKFRVRVLAEVKFHVGWNRHDYSLNKRAAITAVHGSTKRINPTISMRHLPS